MMVFGFMDWIWVFFIEIVFFFGFIIFEIVLSSVVFLVLLVFRMVMICFL